MATLLFVVILLWAGLRPAKLLFYTAQERMTAQNSPINGDLGKKRGVPMSTRMMQDASHLTKELEVAKDWVPGWAASFGMVYQVGLGLEQTFVNLLH